MSAEKRFPFCSLYCHRNDLICRLDFTEPPLVGLKQIWEIMECMRNKFPYSKFPGLWTFFWEISEISADFLESVCSTSWVLSVCMLCITEPTVTAVSFETLCWWLLLLRLNATSSCDFISFISHLEVLHLHVDQFKYCWLFGNSFRCRCDEDLLLYAAVTFKIDFLNCIWTSSDFNINGTDAVPTTFLG